MPIYEFKCLECEEFFEVLVMKSDDEAEMECPKCGKSHFERVMSSTNFTVPGGSQGSATAKGGGVQKQERTCSSGSCSTYTIGGPA